MTDNNPRAAILEAQVDAALAGLEPVDTVSGGYQAECRQCDLTAWVGESGLMYSLLDEDCGQRS